MSRAERLALVEWVPVGAAAELPLSVQAELLSLSRSSLYYQPVLPSTQEVAIKHRIDEVYTACPFYGSRRITAQLVRDGMTINRKTVQRHMREMGIAGVAPGPNLSQRRKGHPVYPYLLRNLKISRVNQVWATDITYIPLERGFAYLLAIIDWYSRRVLSWRLSNTLDSSFCVEALDEALMRFDKPAILMM